MNDITAILRRYGLTVDPMSLPHTNDPDDATVMSVVNALTFAQASIKNEISRLGLSSEPSNDVTLSERKRSDETDLLLLVAIKNAYAAWLSCHAGLTKEDFHNGK